MSLKCKECKKELSVLSGYCPNCGHKTKRNMLLLISGIIVLLLLSIFIIKPLLIDNKGYYSQSEINKIKLNSDTKELLEDNDVDEDLITEYVKEYMQQYNVAFKNETPIEKTRKIQRFSDYFSDEFQAKPKDEFTDVILDFGKLDYINAKYIVEELEIEVDLGTDEEPKIVINEKYFEYKDAMKKEIDNILEKYFN